MHVHTSINRVLPPFNLNFCETTVKSSRLKENVDFCVLTVVELVSRQSLAPFGRCVASVWRRKLFISTLEGSESVFLNCFSLLSLWNQWRTALPPLTDGSIINEGPQH